MRTYLIEMLECPACHGTLEWSITEHPELEHQLMDAPLDTLAPADQFFRGLVLEERGKFREARIAEDSANKGLYTRDYLDCWNSQLD